MPTSPQAELQGRRHSEDAQSPGAYLYACLKLWDSSLAKAPSICDAVGDQWLWESLGPHWAPREPFIVPSAKQHKSLEVT